MTLETMVRLRFFKNSFLTSLLRDFDSRRLCSLVSVLNRFYEFKELMATPSVTLRLSNKFFICIPYMGDANWKSYGISIELFVFPPLLLR